jgi:RNA polymerase sigma factor (sigma-70 family)
VTGTTDQLVELARTGDLGAYDELFDRLGGRLLVYIELRLGPRLRERLEPADILQEAYLDVHRSFERFQPRGENAFTRWVYRIVDNRIRDQADRAGAQKRRAGEEPGAASGLEGVEGLEEVQAQLTGPATRAARAEERAAVVEAMDGLEERERMLLLAHYFEGRAPADLAIELGQTDRHVRRLLRAAEVKLGRALLHGAGPEAPDPSELAARVLAALVLPEGPQSIPERLDRFVVRGVIGRGSMGVVLRARDERMGCDVAVKLLRATAPSARRRFAREAGALLKLAHPNLVGVREVGEHEGAPFLVMDLVQGRSLQARLEAARVQAEGPLPIATAVRLARDLASGLAHAHAAGVLHRDVKPQNVLLTGEPGAPRAVLTDFSLAKLVDRVQSQLSERGRPLGTEGFWPPEQARGELGEIGPAADVYGIGATLYAMLTGRPPFSRGGAMERLRATLEEPPLPPSTLRPEVPPALDALVVRCLAKTPADRFPSADALLAALDDLLATLGAAS